MFFEQTSGINHKKKKQTKTRASVYNFGVFGFTHPLWGWICGSNLSLFCIFFIK
nr:MAG TPA: hypothetical protein [Inoviridae sp.]